MDTPSDIALGQNIYLSEFISLGYIFTDDTTNEYKKKILLYEYKTISMFVLALSKLTAGYIQLIMNILPNVNTILITWYIFRFPCYRLTVNYNVRKLSTGK